MPCASGRQVALLFTDITYRKRAEAALHESEERSRNILESITDAFLAVDRDWRFAYVNRQAERLLGRTPGDLLGKMIWEEFPGLVGSEFEPAYHHAADHRVASTVTAFYPDHNRWYEVRVYPASDGITIYFGDVTERKRAEETLRETAAKNERIAETLQRSLLLAPPPSAYPGVTVEAVYHSAGDDAQIGGDFFDVFAVDESRVALVVGDATGKGIEAATYTAEVKFALRAFLRVEGGRVAAALSRLSDFIARNGSLDTGHGGEGDARGSYVALALVVLDTGTGEAVGACAGAEPPLVLRAAGASASEVAAFGPLLGVAVGGPYEEQSVSLSAGDLLVLTTDGITEARRPRGSGKDRSFFGMSGLAKAAREAISGGAAASAGAVSGRRVRGRVGPRVGGRGPARRRVPASRATPVNPEAAFPRAQAKRSNNRVLLSSWTATAFRRRARPRAEAGAASI